MRRGGRQSHHPVLRIFSYCEKKWRLRTTLRIQAVEAILMYTDSDLGHALCLSIEKSGILDDFLELFDRGCVKRLRFRAAIVILCAEG